MFRSKIRWIENGEKPTKYFFNLEKRNYEKVIITQLRTINGEIITDLSMINEKKKKENYYKNFVTSRIPQDKSNNFDDNFARFSFDLQNLKLAQDKASELEQELTKMNYLMP